MLSRALSLAALVAASLVLGSFQAEAFIAGQAEVGRRNAQFSESGSDKVNGSGTELQVSAILDPIPLVPVGFGLLLATTTMTVKDAAVDKYAGIFAAPQVTAWLPNPSDFKPFVRLGYAIYGNLAGSGTGSGADVSVAYSLTGPLAGVGVKWSFLPLVSALLEYQLFNATLKPTKFDINGVSFKETAENVTMKSGAILVGVEAGI